MTREEMRENVRNKVADRAGCKTPCRMSAVLDCACLNTTDAAIAIIRGETLEEAAQTAELDECGCCTCIAAAIRALAAPSGAMKDKP